MKLEKLENSKNIIHYYFSHLSELRLGIFLILCRVVVVAPIPWVFKIVIDQSVASADVYGILVLILVCFGLLLLHYSMGVAGIKKLGRVTATMIRDLRAMVFHRMQLLSFAYLDRNTTGTLLSKYAVDTQKIQDTLIILSEKVIPDLAYGLATLIVLISLDWRLSGVLLLLIPVYFLLRYYFWNKLKVSHETIRVNQEQLTGKVSELISALRFLRSLGEEERSEKRLQQSNEQLAEANHEMLGTKTVFWTTMYVITQVLSLIIVCGGALLVIHGKLSLGTLIAYLAALPILLLPMDTLTIFSDYYYRGDVSFQSIKELAKNENVETRKGTMEIPGLVGQIEFKGVTFCYPGKPHIRVLENFSLRIQAGENIALVGASGAGKSTITNLILGLYDIQAGSISIDNVPMENISMAWLRRQCAIVMQDTILFTGSIADNLRLAKEDASDEELIEAARAANADEFIAQLPKGYNTIIGERGVGLSGGQRQRLAIARAILRDPKILLLDEATSALDNESEYLVREALKNIAKNRTVITIAHRLSTVRDADRIVVLGEGQILEEGTYEALSNQVGYFKRLVDLNEFAAS